MPQHSSNFTFQPPAFKDLAEASRNAVERIMSDPRAALQHHAFRGDCDSNSSERTNWK